MHTKKTIVGIFIIIFLLVISFLSPTKSYAQVITESPTETPTSGLLTETDYPINTETVSPTESETTDPSETITLNPEDTETIYPTDSETFTPTLNYLLTQTETSTSTPTITGTPTTTTTPTILPTPTTENILQPFYWTLLVKSTSPQNTQLNSSVFDGLTADLENDQLKVSGTDNDNLRTFIFDTSSAYFDFLGGANQTSIVLPANKDPYIIKLEARISTGYKWDVQPGDNYLQIGESTYESRYEALGSPSIQTIQIQNTGTGEVTVNLKYQRSFEPDEPIHAQLMVWANETKNTIDISDPTPEKISLDFSNYGTSNKTLDNISINATLPSSFDWRTYNLLTPVKDQRTCGSCWAFSTVGIMESAIIKAGGGVTNLSEQFLVSCNTRGFSCAGGGYDTHYWHFDTLAKNQTKIGAVLESDYPYTSSDSSCYSVTNHPNRLSGWSFVTAGNATFPTTDQLKAAIYSYGPIKVSICTGDYFAAYTGGVFTKNENVCNGGTNHAVVLLGWDDGTGTWILRNSWGTNWGENGYMRIKYGTSVVGRNASWVVYPKIPAIPTLANPSGLISNTKPTFSWTSVPNAYAYKLLVYNTLTGATAISQSLLASTCSASTCSFTPSSTFAKNTSYTWKVLASNVYGNFKDYSTAKSFTISTPKVPTIIAPSGVIDDTTPSIKWNVSPTATSYIVAVYDVQASNYILIKTIPSTSCTSSLCSYTLTTPLTVGKSYKWKVRAINSIGNSDFSNLIEFSPTKPAAPILVSPTGTVGVTKPTFQWISSTSATVYKLYVYDTVTSRYIISSTINSSACGSTTCSYTSPVALTVNRVYRWKMQAGNLLGSGSLTGFMDMIISTPAAPSLTSPYGSISSIRPTYTWSPVTAATLYKIVVYDSTAAKTIINQNVSSTVCNASICSYTPSTSLVANHLYKWRMLSSNAAGNSVFSSFIDFIPEAPNPPTPSKPSSIIDDTTPTYEWPAITGATSYTISLYNSNTSSIVYTQTVNSSYCGASTCSYTPTTTLSTNVNYQWKILATNGAGSSVYSSSLSFKIAAPTTPLTVEPAGTIYDYSPDFKWYKSTGATTYKLSVYDNAGGYYIRRDSTITPNCGEIFCTYNIGTYMTKNHSTSWTISAYNLIGSSSSSNVFIYK